MYHFIAVKVDIIWQVLMSASELAHEILSDQEWNQFSKKSRQNEGVACKNLSRAFSWFSFEAEMLAITRPAPGHSR